MCGLACIPFTEAFPPGWVPISSVCNELIVCQKEANAKEPVAVLTLWVTEDLTWTISFGKRDEMPEVFPSLKHVYSIATLTAVLGALLEYQVCKGNPTSTWWKWR